MAVWRSCLRASSRHRFSNLPLLFSHHLKPSASISNPPSPSPPPPCFSPLRRFISSSSEFPIISSQDIIANDDSSLPVLTVVNLLDGFHEFTGLPWWMIIASSTVAIRLALLPLLILQLKKLKTISELLPQLPMPIPETPTLKGSIDQFSQFLKESRAIGCPSFLWFFPYLSVQLPCFFLLMASIRKMSLDGHPGFDSGSLVYWVTSSSVNIFQQLSLKHPMVGAKLGLLGQGASPSVGHSMEISESVIKYVDSDSQEQTLSLQTLTPEELLSLSVQVLSKGDKETSIQLLRLALEKDPGYVRGLVLMGQALLQKTQLAEATEYLELAISKLLDGAPSDTEDVELLILASQWAGAAYVQQGKMKNGITHLERVAKLREPGDPKSKEHYFEALLLLSSALYKEGQSDEAAKNLRVVVDHNPAYKPLLEQCEDENELVSDLVSRRKDHY